MPRRLVLSLAVAIVALLLGLVLAFWGRGSTPQPEPQPQPQQEPALPARPAETPVTEEPLQPQSPAGYLLRDYEGRLAIFREDSDTPEMIFDVYTRLLPPADQEKLTAGISALDYETLTRLIEDYIS